MLAFGEDYGGDGDDDQDDAGGGAEGEGLGEGQNAYDHGGEGFEGTEDGAEGGAQRMPAVTLPSSSRMSPPARKPAPTRDRMMAPILTQERGSWKTVIMTAATKSGYMK